MIYSRLLFIFLLIITCFSVTITTPSHGYYQFPSRDEEIIDFVIKLKNDYADDLVSDLFATAHSLEKIARIIEFSRDTPLFHFKLKSSHGPLTHRWKRSMAFEDLLNDDRVEFIVPQPRLKRHKRENIHFNDVKFDKEWYLINKNGLNHDLNIREAWLKGFTGKNITIVIIDDGLDHEHPDFLGKYRADISYDYNDESDLLHDPMPSTFDEENNHGTKCAGAAVASANNSICGVGVAYDALIGGIRILDGPITDILEARALSYRSKDVHIKSASWGPRDDGAHMEYPGIFVNLALEDAVKRGRNGKGTIFVWASGNGGANGDDCSCDGYVSHWNVISIGSINHRGMSPYFMELCPSTFAVAYTGGSVNIRGDEDDPLVRVTTTDVRGKCTSSFQGTSSAAPLASGTIALMLEANPNLGYRDVMYLISKTSKVPNLEDTQGWIVNGAGYHVNEKYGFGVLDASQLVSQAQNWKNVNERFECIIEYDRSLPQIKPFGTFELTLNVINCPNVEQLEHVVVNISFMYSIRGDLKLSLVSPSGTLSEILSFRKNDLNSKPIEYFPFMTIFNWGESPIGKWTLIVESRSRFKSLPNYGRIDYFALRLFGTTKGDLKEQSERDLYFMTNQAFVPSFDELKEIHASETQLARNVRIMRNV